MEAITEEGTKWITAFGEKNQWRIGSVRRFVIHDEIMDARLSLRKISLSAEDVQAFSEEKVRQIAHSNYLREKMKVTGDKGKNTATGGLQRDKLKKTKQRCLPSGHAQKYGRNLSLRHINI